MYDNGAYINDNYMPVTNNDVHGIHAFSSCHCYIHAHIYHYYRPHPVSGSFLTLGNVHLVSNAKESTLPRVHCTNI